jgi:hypothetical protein
MIFLRGVRFVPSLDEAIRSEDALCSVKVEAASPHPIGAFCFIPFESVVTIVGHSAFILSPDNGLRQ